MNVDGSNTTQRDRAAVSIFAHSFPVTFVGIKTIDRVEHFYRSIPAPTTEFSVWSLFPLDDGKFSHTRKKTFRRGIKTMH